MLEEITLEKLKAERSDLYGSIHAQGAEEGTKKERERAVAILKKAKAFKDMGDLALEAVESGRLQKKSLESMAVTDRNEPAPMNEWQVVENSSRKIR